MSEQVGKMAEENAKAAQQHQTGEAEQEVKEPRRRGDGTILKERGDVPPNPKKKVFDTAIEDAKHEANKRDEL